MKIKIKIVELSLWSCIIKITIRLPKLGRFLQSMATNRSVYRPHHGAYATLQTERFVGHRKVAPVVGFMFKNDYRVIIVAVFLVGILLGYLLSLNSQSLIYCLQDEGGFSVCKRGGVPNKEDISWSLNLLKQTVRE